MLRCGFNDHGAVAVVVEYGALVVTFGVRDGDNVVFVVSDDSHMASMVSSECHVAVIVKLVNKSRV